MKGFAFRFAVLFAAVFAALFFLVWFYLSVTAVEAAERDSPAAEPMASAVVHIEGGDGRHLFRVEIATTPDQHARGLMFRESVPPGTGMLFDFATPRPITMWMRNTPASLDMLFVDAGGAIVFIAESTTPFSLDAIGPPATVPVRYVLEVAAGTARQLGIAPGHRLKVQGSGAEDALKDCEPARWQGVLAPGAQKP